MRHDPRGPAAVPDEQASGGTPVWFLLGIALLYAGYFVLRYGGLWTENDTSDFTRTAMQTIAAGNVLFTGQYGHGFGYPAWLGSLCLLTGAPVEVMNTVVLPFVSALAAVLVAFLAYRSLLGSNRLGGLSVLFLFPTADLWFSLLRGNHEKLNIVFLLAAIYALFCGFAAIGRGSAGRLAFWTALFYLLVWGNAVVNDYFGSAFVFASTLTLAGGYAFSCHHSFVAYRRLMLRFALTVALSWLVVWLVVLYIFPPARSDFQLVHTTGTQVARLVTTFQTSSNPYADPATQWANPLTAEVLAAFRWILLGGSAISWLWRMPHLLLGRARMPFDRLFLLALYGAFALVMALSIPVDYSGLYAGSNLELRNFTDFALIAVPMLAWGVADLLSAIRSPSPLEPGTLFGRIPIPPRLRVLLSRSSGWPPTVMGLALICFILLGLLKSTIDPLVSNWWSYYSPAEEQALVFFRHHPGPDWLWAGPDNRVENQAKVIYPFDTGIIPVKGYDLAPETRDLLISPQVTTDAIDLRFPLPPYGAQNRIYDDGGAQIYHDAPQTPFQH